MTEQNDLQDLFFYVHDLLLTKVEVKDQAVILDLLFPGPPLNGTGDNHIHVVLENCRNFRCDFAMALETAENLAQLPGARQYVERSSTDPLEISKLLLEPQHFDHAPPDNYVLHCNSSNGKCGGGKLYLSSSGFKLFSSLGDELGIDMVDSWFSEMKRQRDGGHPPE